MESTNEVGLLRLESPRANAMNPEFLERLDRLFADCRARAVVLTGYDRFFSAGLDLPTLAGFDRDRMRDLLLRFHRSMLRLFSCPLPVVAAINGHAIAGGCVLAMQADYRIMAGGDFKIGLNEVALGVGLPSVVVESFRAQLSPPALATLFLEGPLLSPEEALKCGLVHELVAPEGLIPRAVEKAEALARAGAAAYEQIKRALRRPAVDAMEASLETTTELWLDAWFSDETRNRVGETVLRLTQSARARP